MRDAGTAIRKAFFNALGGEVEIEGSKIPFVDEKVDEEITEHDLYVAMSTQRDEYRGNKSYFASEIIISLVILQRSNATVKKSDVESVSNQIMQIVIPSVGSHGLTIESPFRITYLKKDNSQTEAARLEDGTYVIAKQLNFRIRITQ